MKKLLAVFLSVILICSAISGIAVYAAGLTFTDDFSSGNFSKWSNLALEQGDKADTECAGKATIANKTLSIKNFDPVGSFFYLSPKNIKTKNFTISMKAKTNKLNDSWIGFSIRKDTNDRFNGCNNILITFRMPKPDDKGNNVPSYMQANRGYAGQITAIDGNITEKGTFTGDLRQYHTYKIVAKDTTFTGYIDDVKMGVLTYDKKLTNEPGFVSINCCLADVDIQDFKLITEDGFVVTSGVSSSPKSTTSTPKTSTQNSTVTSKTSNAASTVTSNQTSTDASSSAISEDQNTTSTDSQSLGTSSTGSNSNNDPKTGGSSGFPLIPVIIAGAAIIIIAAGALVYFKVIKK